MVQLSMFGPGECRCLMYINAYFALTDNWSITSTYIILFSVVDEQLPSQNYIQVQNLDNFEKVLSSLAWNKPVVKATVRTYRSDHRECNAGCYVNTNLFYLLFYIRLCNFTCVRPQSAYFASSIRAGVSIAISLTQTFQLVC